MRFRVPNTGGQQAADGVGSFFRALAMAPMAEAQAYLNNRVASAQYPNGLPQQSSGSSFFGNLFTGKRNVGQVTP